MSEGSEVVRHLSELRTRLIRIILWFVMTLASGFYLSKQILLYIKHSPAAAQVEWNVFSFTDGMFIYMKCAFLFALLLSLPVVFYHIWSFVKPGLTEEEARGTFVYIPVSFALFLIGILFSYFVVFPMMVDFMKSVNASIGAKERYGLNQYFSFLFNVLFPMGVAFEMPLVVVFLTRIGLLTPNKLKQTRKYAYLGLAVVGALISPPDFVSHLSVTVPLILLFELSVVISGWYYRRLLVAQAGV